MSFEIVIDAKNPFALAHFWAAAHTEYEVRAYDHQELARLAGLGLTPETDMSVAIDAANGPTIWFQQSNETSTVRNRIHFDLKVAQRESEVARLSLLGATVYDVRADHVVMLDPEGNQFCVFDA